MIKKNLLKEFNINVDIMDPWCSSEEAQHEYGLKLSTDVKLNYYDAIILAVSHNQFKAMGADTIKSFGKSNHVLYDLKYILNKAEVDMRL